MAHWLPWACGGCICLRLRCLTPTGDTVEEKGVVDNGEVSAVVVDELDGRNIDISFTTYSRR